MNRTCDKIIDLLLIAIVTLWGRIICIGKMLAKLMVFIIFVVIIIIIHEFKEDLYEALLFC